MRAADRKGCNLGSADDCTPIVLDADKARHRIGRDGIDAPGKTQALGSRSKQSQPDRPSGVTRKCMGRKPTAADDSHARFWSMVLMSDWRDLARDKR